MNLFCSVDQNDKGKSCFVSNIFITGHFKAFVGIYWMKE